MKLLLMLALAVSCSAETHRFQPTEFYNTFSGAHAPVLRIKPGDHVVTFTIDARGFDSAGVQRAKRPILRRARFLSEQPLRSARGIDHASRGQNYKTNRFVDLDICGKPADCEKVLVPSVR